MFMFKSIVAFSVAIGTAASSSHPHSAILNHDIFRILSRPELLRQLAGSQLTRRIQNDDESCPGTPFLWKIIEDATGDHVGFGVGTMHLPPDLALTDEAWDSISSAIEGK